MSHWDLLLYALIAGLNALVGLPDPLTWRSVVTVTLAVLIAVKAKRSPGKDAPVPVVEADGLAQVPGAGA